MELADGKKYKIFRNGNPNLYIIKKRGQINICIKDFDYEKNDYVFGKWLRESYLDVELVKRYEEDDIAYCYLLFKKPEGQGELIEIVENKVILKDFMYDDCKVYDVEYRVDDAIIRICNNDSKTISFFSIKNGYVYGPTKYNKIKLYEEGALIDENLYVTEFGHLLYENFSSFVYKDDVEVGDVYFIGSSQKYILLHAKLGVCFLEPDEKESDIQKTELEFSRIERDENDKRRKRYDYYVFKYNTVTGFSSYNFVESTFYRKS